MKWKEIEWILIANLFWKSGEREKAILFIGNQEKIKPKNKLIVGSKAIFEGKVPMKILPAEKKADLLIIETLFKN